MKINTKPVPEPNDEIRKKLNRLKYNILFTFRIIFNNLKDYIRIRVLIDIKK